MPGGRLGQYYTAMPLAAVVITNVMWCMVSLLFCWLFSAVRSHTHTLASTASCTLSGHHEKTPRKWCMV